MLVGLARDGTDEQKAKAAWLLKSLARNNPRVSIFNDRTTSSNNAAPDKPGLDLPDNRFGPFTVPSCGCGNSTRAPTSARPPQATFSGHATVRLQQPGLLHPSHFSCCRAARATNGSSGLPMPRISVSCGMPIQSCCGYLVTPRGRLACSACS